MLELIGRGERIRTSDLTVPNRALYQAEPRPDLCGMIGNVILCVKPDPRISADYKARIEDSINKVLWGSRTI